MPKGDNARRRRTTPGRRKGERENVGDLSRTWRILARIHRESLVRQIMAWRNSNRALALYYRDGRKNPAYKIEVLNAAQKPAVTYAANVNPGFRFIEVIREDRQIRGPPSEQVEARLDEVPSLLAKARLPPRLIIQIPLDGRGLQTLQETMNRAIDLANRLAQVDIRRLHPKEKPDA